MRADPPPGVAAFAAGARRGGARDQHVRRARAGVGDRGTPARRVARADAVRHALSRAVRLGAREAARGEPDDGGLRRGWPRRVPGAASRSYGIHVAKLAGLPEAVLARARDILANLEAQELDEAGHPALASARRRARAQLGLFGDSQPVSAPAQPADPPPKDPRAAELLESLQSLDLPRTSPLDALLWLHEQQKKLR